MSPSAFSRARNGVKLIVFAVAFIAFCLSNIVLHQEVRALQLAAAELPERYELQLFKPMKEVPSYRAQQYLVEVCFEVTTSLYARLKSSVERQVVVQTCDQQIEKILESNPTNGLAWFAKALVGHLQDDERALNKGLTMSRQVAPYENWIAELRVDLSEDARASLSIQNLHGNDEDLLRLVNSWRGIQAITARFEKDLLFRERVIGLVEELDEITQAQFIRAIRTRAR